MNTGAVRFRVEGRVQGVGFRFWAWREARSRGLRGWIRNDPDGAVSGLAAGDSNRLEEFRRLLAVGPPAAHVDSVEWIDQAEGLPLGEFEIHS